MRILFTILSLLIESASLIAADQAPAINTVEIRVDDYAKAKTFYIEMLGFKPAGQSLGGDRALLVLDEINFVIQQVTQRRKINYESEAHTNLNLAVDSLENFVKRLRAAGCSVLDTVPRPSQIGVYYRVFDPAGNMIHLIEPNFDMGPMPMPRLFNIGIQIVDMQKARDFYVRELGIPVLTEKYYPPVVPLKTSGAEVILHEGSTARAESDSESMTGISIVVSRDSGKSVSPSARNAVRDPDGNLLFISQDR